MINDYKIEYVEMGTHHQQCLVFAHGMGCDYTMWHDQLVCFSRDYHVIAFSMQGHGHSSHPKKASHYTIEAYAKTAETLLKDLHVSSCMWVGHSMGGVIGYHLRANHPELISALITSGTTPRLKYPKWMTSLIVLADRLMLGTMGLKGMLSLLAKQVTKDPVAQMKILSTMQTASKHMIPATHRALAHYDYLVSMDVNESPITILRAEFDQDINVSLDEYQAFFDLCDHIKMMQLEGVSHMASMEKPTLFNTHLEKVLKEFLAT